MKNDELPLQFFLDYAWNPNRWPIERLHQWERAYAAESFRPALANAIANVLRRYEHLQARRKPELLNRRIGLDPTKDLQMDPSAVVYDDEASPFSLVNYGEIQRVTEQWRRLAAQSERIRRQIPRSWQDAYFELVDYQVKATANLYALREAEFKNLLYAAQGRAATNRMADVAQARFADDQAMSDYYNRQLAGGKWNGWQTQPKIGYGDVARYGPNAPWQQPELNNEALPDEIYPHLRRIELPVAAETGVAVAGSESWWPAALPPPVLPVFSRYQTAPPPYIEVFDRGATAFDYRIRSGASWLDVSRSRGRVASRCAPPCASTGHAPRTAGRACRSSCRASAAARSRFRRLIENRRRPVSGFVEAGGVVSMKADHFSSAVGGWKRIPDIGRTGAGMVPWPPTRPSVTPGGRGPRLDYRMTLFRPGPVKVWAYLSPRNDVLNHGLRYAVSIDQGPLQTVDAVKATGADSTAINRQWERNTSDNVNRTVTTHVIERPGRHVLHFWMVDRHRRPPEPHRRRRRPARELPRAAREPASRSMSPLPRRWNLGTFAACLLVVAAAGAPAVIAAGGAPSAGARHASQPARAVGMGDELGRDTAVDRAGQHAAGAIALPSGGGAGVSAIEPRSSRPVTFGGRSSTIIPTGALMVSDPVRLDVPSQANVTVTLYLGAGQASEDITSHPGSRTTSYLLRGDATDATDLPGAAPVDHWYFLSGLEVRATPRATAVATLGDSLTDGRGSTTNGNDRWPDQLLARLQSRASTRDVAVINEAAGGNRVLNDGLGPNALARFDRDVIAQSGVEAAIVFEGVNDIGTADATAAAQTAVGDDLIRAYEQIVVRAHAQGIRVYGATITPFGGNARYDDPAHLRERTRDAVNAWIGSSGWFDAVLDFDQAVRDRGILRACCRPTTWGITSTATRPATAPSPPASHHGCSVELTPAAASRLG